jgi:hypothetical protein
MTQRFELRKVQYMPTALEPGLLYVAEQFKAAAHLCACGCGTVVRTPLNRWTLIETENGPSLKPSIGNWEESCQSHYWIESGRVRWDKKWMPEQIAAGRRHEEQRRRAYYEQLDRKRGKFRRFLHWFKELFR